MADICTASDNPCASGGHRDFTVAGRTYRCADAELAIALTDAEIDTLNLLGLRKAYQSGVPFAQFVGRVIRGEEATNVKQYDLIGAGVAITKTAIGTAYTNILPGANGERMLVDFTGCTKYRIILSANLVGSGQWGARVIKDGDSTVLFAAANLGAAGERELDSDWQDIPAGFTGLEVVRLQGKSQTGADSPVFRRCVLLAK